MKQSWNILDSGSFHNYHYWNDEGVSWVILIDF